QDFLSQTLQVLFSTVLVTNWGQPLALLLSDNLTVLDDVIPIPQEPTSALFEDESFLAHETFSLPYLGIATLRRYSEIVMFDALALLRIFTASAFVATNRKMTCRRWLGAISGLPARLPIASSVMVLFIPS